MAISYNQVINTEKEIIAAQQELPEAGQFKASISSLRDTLLILKDVWNTEGGANQIGKLNSCIEEQLQALKSAKVTYTTYHHKELINTEPINNKVI